MFLLELQQYSTRHIVGLFPTEEDVKEWLNTIEGIQIRKEQFEDIAFEDYYIPYADLPEYQEINWRDSRFILSRHAFSSEDGDIIAVWDTVQNIAETNGIVDGQTKIGAYMIDNKEVKAYLDSYEEMKHYLLDYFEAQGKQAAIRGEETEDGTYLEVDDHMISHLEGLLVEQWQNKTSKEAFVEELMKNISL